MIRVPDPLFPSAWWRGVRRTLPPALVALVFVVALAAAAPHSVHHMGGEEDAGPVQCPGVLAWSTASGADSLAPVPTLLPPAALEYFLSEHPLRPLTTRALPHSGRSPPPTHA